MELVRIAVLSLAACGLAAGADFGIDVGSPVASAPPSGNPNVTTKVKGAAFSVRTHGCSGEAKFSGTAKESSGSEETLTFVPGAARSFAVAHFGRSAWVAVVTADCAGTKAGALVPVNAQGLYERDGVKFYSHAPTAAEVDEAFKKLQGGSR